MDLVFKMLIIGGSVTYGRNCAAWPKGVYCSEEDKNLYVHKLTIH